MSAGAVFKLIANDGKSDRLIMATKLLQQRIKDVMCARKRAGKADITPTLVDLERTHILYVNSHFKPFAAIGFEYNKVLPQSGNPTLGGGVTFSIPQFGDFFHDMVCRVRLSSFYGKEGRTPLQGSGGFPLNTGVDDPIFAQFYITDISGKVIILGGDRVSTDTTIYRNYVRYCEYPGNRLFNQVKFDVNGNSLDQYDQFVPVMLEKFCVPPNKRVGYNRLVGQEVPITGYGSLEVASVIDADSANTPSGINKAAANQSNQSVGLIADTVINDSEITATVEPSYLLNQTKISDLDNPGSLNDYSRPLKQYVNGPQTPKPVQPPLEIWNKLKFWFNDDVSLSIASVSIPFGQRFITIDLCPQTQLAFEYPSIYCQIRGTQNAAPLGVADIKYGVSYFNIFQPLGMTEIKIEKMELYINNIFVNPEIHDIYLKRVGFSLIRVYRQHTQRCNQEGYDEILLSQLKWPIEYMFVGLRPIWNVKTVAPAADGTVTGNENMWRDWHRMTRNVDVTRGDKIYVEIPDIELTGPNLSDCNIIKSNEPAAIGIYI